MKCSVIRLLLVEPAGHVRVFVGGVVVDHDVQLAPRVGLRDLLEEAQELLVPVPRVAGVGHLAGGHLQRREQRRGAVPHIVVRSASPAHRAVAAAPARCGPAPALGISHRHTARSPCSGGFRYSPTTSRILASSSWVGGELERLHPPRLQAPLLPRRGHREVADAQMLGQQPARPVRHTQLRAAAAPASPTRWRPGRSARGRPDLGRSSNPATPSAATAASSRSPPACSTRPGARSRSCPPRRQPATPPCARCARPARNDGDRVHDSNSSRSRADSSTRHSQRHAS